MNKHILRLKANLYGWLIDICKSIRKYMNNSVLFQDVYMNKYFVLRVWISVPRELSEDLVSLFLILYSPFSFYSSLFPSKNPNKNLFHFILICLSFPVCSNGLLHLRLFFLMHGSRCSARCYPQYVQIPGRAGVCGTFWISEEASFRVQSLVN